jgi:excisionase family DNA binding protein
MGKSSEKISRQIAPASSEVAAGIRELISKTSELVKVWNSVSRGTSELDVAALESNLLLNIPSETPLLISRERIAARYNVSVRTIDNWMADRTLPYYKRGGVVRFHKDECDEALKKFRNESRWEKSQDTD